MAKRTKKRKPVECRVRGNKVFFYGKAARLIQKAIAVTGETPDQFLHRALTNKIESLRREGKLK